MSTTPPDLKVAAGSFGSDAGSQGNLGSLGVGSFMKGWSHACARLDLRRFAAEQPSAAGAVLRRGRRRGVAGSIEFPGRRLAELAARAGLLSDRRLRRDPAPVVALRRHRDWSWLSFTATPEWNESLFIWTSA